MRRLIVLVITLAATALAACAPAAPNPAPTGSTSGPPGGGLVTPVSITRTGGLAGVRQTVDISADGSWTYTDARAGASTQGRLTPAQLSALVALLTDPKLIQALSDHATPTGVCNDGFEYTLRFGSSDTFTFVDCGEMAPPVRAVIEAVTDDTPF